MLRLYTVTSALTGLVVVAGISSSMAFAQSTGRVPLVGLLDGGSFSSGNRRNWQAFHEELRKLGYIEGKSIAFVRREAKRNVARLPSLAAELVSCRAVVIVTYGTQAAVAAKRATSTVPIVMALASRTIQTGLIKSLARPGGNVTGMELGIIHKKGFELLRNIVPAVSRVGLLWDSSNPAAARMLPTYKASAHKLGWDVLAFRVRASSDIDQAFESMAKNSADAAIVISSSRMILHRQLIADLAIKHRIPTVSGSSLFTEAGVLASFSQDSRDMFRRAARYVDKILRAAKPADLPVQRASTFEIVVNLKTAKSLGITIPPSILLRADKVIE